MYILVMESYICNVFDYIYCFFFSSRRRHTRCALVTGVQTCALPILMAQIEIGLRPVVGDIDLAMLIGAHRARIDVEIGIELANAEIGRASCRERVCQYV